MSKLSFAHDLNDLSYPVSSKSALVEIIIGGQVALKEELRSTQGKLTLVGLGSLVLSYASGRITSVSIKVGGSVVDDYTVLPLSQHLGISADTYCAQHYLSLGPTDRYTYGDAQEQLSWIGSDRMTVTAYWWLSDGRVQRTEHSPLSSGDGLVHTADVSPRTMSGEGELVEYTASCGGREVTYHVLPMGCCVGARSVLMRNGFGVLESVTMVQTVRESKSEVTSVRVGGELRNYHTDAGLRTTLTYGPLQVYDYTLVDLLSSKEVYLLPQRTRMIVDSIGESVVHDPYSLQWGTVTLRPSGDGIELAPLGRSRVFDDHFDNSFE
nr:MAG TPA: hypothetical protein [Caudoviricetes sp.]